MTYWAGMLGMARAAGWRKFTGNRDQTQKTTRNSPVTSDSTDTSIQQNLGAPADLHLEPEQLPQGSVPGGRRRSVDGAMSQLAVGPRLFTVAVKVYARHSQNVPQLGDATDEVPHRGMAIGAGTAQWQAENGAHVIFELAGLRAFDSPVAGVVDARSHLIDEK